MSKKRLISCFIVPLILLSCTQAEPPGKKVNKGPVFLVLVTSLSEHLSGSGESMLRGAKLRMGSSNTQTLENKKHVKLIVLDDKGNPEKATELAKNMTSHPSVAAVVGHLTTGCTLSALPVYAREEIPLVSPVATGRDLDNIKTGHIFRTVLSEGQQAISLAGYIARKTEGRRVLTIYEDSPLGNTLRDSFKTGAGEAGLSVEEIQLKTDLGIGPGPLRDSIKEANPGAVFLAASPRSAGLVVRKLPELIDKYMVFGTYRLISEEFMETAGEEGKGVFAAHPCIRGQDFKRVQEVRALYERRFKYTMAQSTFCCGQ